MTVRPLFPFRDENLPIEGLYLGLNLHRQAVEGETLIYSNFVASLDGRISRFDEAKGDYGVPGELANEHDWRLYQELAAQSDLLIVSGRYLRQLAKGTAQDMLPVGKKFKDLIEWRLKQGLKAQPDVAIISNSLDIPLDAIDRFSDRSVVVLTSDMAPVERTAPLEAFGARVIPAGEMRVEGKRVKHVLSALGYSSIYMIAGPGVHSTLIRDGVLDRLFLTTRFTLLGSDRTHGLYDGSGIDGLRLRSLFLDSEGGQLFAQYEMEKR